MSKFVLTDVTVSVASVDLSAYVAQVELKESADEIETTAFGSTSRTRIGGLRDNEVSLTFHQTFGSALVNATIRPLVGSTATVVIKPTSGTVSPTNPSHTFSALVTEWGFGGSIGELAEQSVTWPISGAITIGTA